MTKKENLFILETIEALLKGSIIGKNHYSVTLSRIELKDLQHKFKLLRGETHDK